MNKHFFIAWLVAFILWMAGDFGVHGAWLAPDYMQHAALYRPEADQMKYMPYMMLAHVVMAGGVAWIYGRGVTAAAWAGQGIRFGIALACVTSSSYVIYYSIQPLPHQLVLNQLIGNTAVMLLVGLGTAFVHKGAKTA
jgi:hypothetical protein